MSRWETVTPRLESHVREPNRDGIDFELTPAEREIAENAMESIRQQVRERNLAERRGLPA